MFFSSKPFKTKLKSTQVQQSISIFSRLTQVVVGKIGTFIAETHKLYCDVDRVFFDKINIFENR
jgi:hypothetical protein